MGLCPSIARGIQFKDIGRAAIYAPIIISSRSYDSGVATDRDNHTKRISKCGVRCGEFLGLSPCVARRIQFKDIGRAAIYAPIIISSRSYDSGVATDRDNHTKRISKCGVRCGEFLGLSPCVARRIQFKDIGRATRSPGIRVSTSAHNGRIAANRDTGSENVPRCSIRCGEFLSLGPRIGRRVQFKNVSGSRIAPTVVVPISSHNNGIPTDRDTVAKSVTCCRVTRC